MPGYAFPMHLFEEIKARWESARTSSQSRLPDSGTLQRLLETCYHASLRTTELRPIRCALAYVSVQVCPQESLLLFEFPATLTDRELVRLAPVTDLHRTLIGCDDIEGQLRIWGLYEHGRTWSEFSAPLQPESKPPPDLLTITLEAPGALNVACGGRGLVRLREGAIILPQQNPLRQQDEPLGQFFGQLVNDVQEASPYRERLQAIQRNDETQTLFDIYTTTVAAILERIQSQRHGGSLVITRLTLDTQLAYRTYAVAEHRALADSIVSHYEALRTLAEAPAAQAGELEHYRAQAAVRVTNQQLTHGVNRVGLLAAVDGAVLLDSKLRIEGFGVRFPVLLPPRTTICDAPTGTEYTCDKWGLRHQSVFSICQKCEDAVGLVVSQDGGVMAVKAIAGKLFFWERLLD